MAVFGVVAEQADYEGTSTILGVLVAAIIWAGLYLALVLLNSPPNKPSHRTPEWNCHIVAFLHASLMIALTSWSGFVQGPWPFTEPGGENTRLQHLVCFVCLGYFLYDLVWCLYYQTEGMAMLLHHVLSIYGQCLILVRGRNGTEMMATLWGSELTNPMLNIRWFLRSTDKQHTWYAQVNEHVFMLLFGIVRIGIGGILLYTTCTHPRPDWLSKSGGAMIYGLSWVFWVMILKYAYRKYAKILSEWREKTESSSVDQQSQAITKSHVSKRVVWNGSGVENLRRSDDCSRLDSVKSPVNGSGLVKDETTSSVLKENGMHVNSANVCDANQNGVCSNGAMCDDPSQVTHKKGHERSESAEIGVDMHEIVHQNGVLTHAKID